MLHLSRHFFIIAGIIIIALICLEPLCRYVWQRRKFARNKTEEIKTATSDSMPETLEPDATTAGIAESEIPAERTPIPTLTEPTPPTLPEAANESLREPLRAQNKPQKAEIGPDPNLIMLTVMSLDNKKFRGYDLVKALEENYLHFGQWSIYHRHKYRNGKGPRYFSVASVINPGTLNPERLADLSVPGLALFMPRDNPKHDRIIFRQMLLTAEDLAKRLVGVVCDAERTPLNETSLAKYEAACFL
jgi:cell division protein ZipA